MELLKPSFSVFYYKSIVLYNKTLTLD